MRDLKDTDGGDSVIKNDKTDGKLHYTFVHPAVQYQVGLAFLWGQKKYGDGWNYMRPKGHAASQLVAATKRHIDKYFYEKQDFDKESSTGVNCRVHHLANAISDLTMLLAQIIEGTIEDDRPLRALTVPTTKEEFNELFNKKEEC